MFSPPYLSFLVAGLIAIGPVTLATAAEPVPRVIPPVGNRIRTAQKENLETALKRETDRFRAIPFSPENANAEVFLKAVGYALAHGEFYRENDADAAMVLLEEAGRRITQLSAGQHPWKEATGLVVRGYYSSIDGSAQPFALEIPPDAPASQAPAWFWLQGRGEKRTDLQFLAERMNKKGEFQPEGALVVHPWGRYCLGYKGPGEQDVLAVRELLIQEKRVDPRRTVIAGFSMGGAGAWLLGAHYPDRWAAVHTGAGFVDVRQYQKLSADRIDALPPWERTLWGLNDIPGYTRNLLNVPVISYSGEKDAQRASAEIMAGEFQKQGAALTHYIGPGMGHKYDPAVRQQIQKEIEGLLKKPLVAFPSKVTLQTRTLAYPQVNWIRATGLEKHWEESRIDASLSPEGRTFSNLSFITRNVSSFQFHVPESSQGAAVCRLEIDGQVLPWFSTQEQTEWVKRNGRWVQGSHAPGLRKRPGLQGPIDDAFNGSFLHVLPDRPGFHPDTDAWVRAESAAQLSRWRTTFRGDARVKTASEVTAADLKNHHLILWGDPKGNPVLGKHLKHLPLEWTAEKIALQGQTWSAAGNLPVLIYPAPGDSGKYFVLNSGPTFREAHSKTNSQQNPKLPDWAVLDITTPPTPDAAGTVRKAGFFDEDWK